MPQKLVGPRQIDIGPFLELNNRTDVKQARIERQALIKQVFPEIDWLDAFNKDPELMGSILKDILKSQFSTRGPGPRQPLHRARSEPALDEIMGNNPTDRPYSNLPFNEALRLLLGKRSIRSAERKLGISKTRLHRLITGEAAPRLDEMEKIAKVFKKLPSYFADYRTQVISDAIVQHLTSYPETTIRIYERYRQSA